MEHRGVKETKNWRLLGSGPVRPVKGTNTHGQHVQRERPSASTAATEAISARFAEPERGNLNRSTPGITGKSPAEILMGRRLRTKLPMVPGQLHPTNLSQAELIRRDHRARDKQRQGFNKRHGTKALRTLHIGDRVWVTDMKAKAEVVAPARRPRSYEVQTSSGVTLVRNRTSLRFLPRQQETGGSYDFPASMNRGKDEMVSNTVQSSALVSAPVTSRESYDSPVVITRYGRTIRKPKR